MSNRFRKSTALVGLVAAFALLVTACGATGNNPDTPGTDFENDGCTSVITAVSPEKLNMMTALASDFKNSPQHAALETCATIHPLEVGSGTAGNLLKGSGELWSSSQTNLPRPVLWSPASSIWMDEVAAVNGEALVEGWKSFVRTPVVFAIPERMAEKLGWPNKPISIHDLHDLCLAPEGWGRYGGAAASWGKFKLGKTNPNSSTTGLNTLMMQSYAHSGKTEDLTAADVTAAEQFSAEFESCVIHYGDTTGNVLQRVYDRDAEGRPLDYVSAIAVEEISVIAYNKGNPNTRAYTPDEEAQLTPPREKLIAVYPSEGSLTSDNPIVVLGGPKASWVTPDQAKAGKAFIEFLLSEQVQDKVDEYGMRPLDPKRKVDGLFTAQYGVDPNQPATWLEKPPVSVSFAAKTQWEAIRKPSSVLVLIDVSGSMGDDIGNGMTRLDGARESAKIALKHFRPTDELGIWTFTSGDGFDGGTAEIRPVKPLEGDLENLSGELDDLTPLNGTPLYDAIAKAHGYMSGLAETGRINAIVVLSDGDDSGSNIAYDALIAGLRGSEEGANDAPVRVFPIIYGGGLSDSGKSVLRSIAEASGGQLFDASDPTKIDAVLQSVIRNF